METETLSRKIRKEILDLCQSAQYEALKEDKADPLDCGCLTETSDRPKFRWLRWD